MRQLEKLREKIAELGIEALLVSGSENRRYLSGFAGSFGFLLILAKSALLFTDFRYIEQAKREARGFEVVRLKGEAYQWLAEAVAEQRIKKLGVEAQALSLAAYQKLQDSLAGVELIPTYGVVEELRAIKDKEELGLIKKVVKLGDQAMEYILNTLRPGMEEREVSWLAEKFLRENGSAPLPFEVIVASGLNSALPHARPTSRVIDTKTPIIIDLGAQINGYCSDLTRTFFLGDPGATFHKAYETVLAAQEIAIENIKPGMTGEEADRIARQVIEEAGYGEAFGHGLGHGIGVSPHEAPRLAPGSEDVLKEGMVFTIEPGIYLPDWGGIRIEDVVVLEKEGVRVLSHAKKYQF